MLPSTIQADIYKLNVERDKLDASKYVETLIDNHNSNPDNHTYEIIKLRTGIHAEKDIEVELYINRNEDRPPEWIDFVKSIVAPEEVNKIDRLQRKYPSFLLFVYTPSSIYVVTRGAGRFVIDKIVETDFGIQVLERLVTSTQTDIRSINERGVIGTVLAANRFFKPNHKFSQERKFGKYFVGVEAVVDKAQLSSALKISTTRTGLIIGGATTLKINKQIEIKDLVERVSLVDKLLKQPKKTPINKFRKLSAKELKQSSGGQPLKDVLTQKLSETAHHIFDVQKLDDELYHPKIFDFLEADSIIFIYNGQEEEVPTSERIIFRSIFDAFGLNPRSLNDFKDAIDDIECALILPGNRHKRFRTSLREWLTGEVVKGAKKYFRFDGDWYIYENAFIREINQSIQDLLASIGPQTNLPAWNYTAIKKSGKRDNEHQYNLGFRGPDYIVCDTALMDGIEICDFFKIEKNKIVFYHVKNGWGQSIRVVYNQIMNGARFIAEVRENNDRARLKNYFNLVKKKNYKTGSGFKVSWTDFQRILKPNIEITFNLVYGTTNRNNRDQQIQRSRSNLAKLSLIECDYYLRTNYRFSLDITQVKVK